MNRYKNQRRLISENKFSRMFSHNTDKAGVACVWKGHDIGFVNSLQAFVLDDFVYARFPCKRREGNRLKSYCVRYDLLNPLDYVSFMPYPAPVFAVCDF